MMVYLKIERDYYAIMFNLGFSFLVCQSYLTLENRMSYGLINLILVVVSLFLDVISFMKYGSILTKFLDLPIIWSAMQL